MYILYAFSVVLFVIMQIVFYQKKILITDFCKYLFLHAWPQGSHWYMQFILLWYIVFWFLSFLLQKRSRVFGIIVASALVLVGMHGNISAVWQIFLFPLGIVVALYTQKACLVKSHVKSRGIASSCYSIGDIEKNFLC